MSELFSHAGVSKLNGEFKVRFANDALRVKVLAKNGHKDIDIVELKTPMSKADAVAYLLSIDFDNGNKAVRAALEAAMDKRSEKPKATKEAPKAKAVAKKAAPKAKAKPAKVAAEPTMTVAEANDSIVAQMKQKYPEQFEDALM